MWKKKQSSFRGQIVDVIFKSKNGNKLGCTKVGLNNSKNSTKVLDDGKFKIFKTLKEILLRPINT